MTERAAHDCLPPHVPFRLALLHPDQMKLAVSNICWPAEEDTTIAHRLRNAGADAIEVAPSRIFPDVPLATKEDATKVRQHWETEGLPIISMQALLYGRPDLALFSDEDGEAKFVDYLSHVIALAGSLGCGPLVFGSPKNRLKGAMNFQTAARTAARVFRFLGKISGEHGCVLCLEANARAYGCDFMTLLEESATVAAETSHGSVGMVLDTGNMLMEGDDLGVVKLHPELIRHLHFSAPELLSVRPYLPVLSETLRKLKATGYGGDMTIEMRPLESIKDLLTIIEGVRAVLDETIV